MQLGSRLTIGCSKCRESGILVPAEWQSLRETLEKFIHDLDPPSPYLSQWYFDPDTILRIVSYMAHKGDLEHRKIACLMAPTVALALGKTNLAKHVAAIDVDKNLLEALQSNCPNVTTIAYDLNEDPEEIELDGGFDCWIADPPYEEDWIKLTISRGTSLIGGKRGRVGYIAIPPPRIAYPKRLGFPPLSASILSALETSGYFLEDLKEGFLEYENPPFEVAVLRKRTKTEPTANWRVSNLLRMELFRKVYASIRGETDLQTRSYGRYRRRFLTFSSEFPPHDRYEKPEPEVHEPYEWDDLVDANPPYYLAFHDVGDWGKPADRHIKLRGPVAAYSWDLLQDTLKRQSVISKGAIDNIAGLIKNKFTGCPDEDTVRNDLRDLVNKLVGLELLSPSEISM